METFEYYFGVTIMLKILGDSDKLSRSIQSPDLTATDAKYLENCTVETLEKIRNDRDFDLLWNDINEKAHSLDLRESKQPRKRKVPQKLLENDTASIIYDEVSDVKTYHCIIYFNVLDAVINAVKDRFDQFGYTNYENIKQLLLSAVHGKCTQSWVDEVKKTYEGDINTYLLDSQLESLSVEFKNKDSVCIRDINNHMKELGSKTIMFSGILILLKIMIAAPVTNAVSERSGSQFRRVKTWLRTTMSQERLN